MKRKRKKATHLVVVRVTSKQSAFSINANVTEVVKNDPSSPPELKL